MYSRSKGQIDKNCSLTPPPGYDGSRFRRRSDGRDDHFPLYGESSDGISSYEAPKSPALSGTTSSQHCPKGGVCHDGDCTERTSETEICEKSCADEDKTEKEKSNKLSEFLSCVRSEDILLIALIVLLAGDRSREGLEIVIILSLLLCIS